MIKMLDFQMDAIIDWNAPTLLQVMLQKFDQLDKRRGCQLI